MSALELADFDFEMERNQILWLSLARNQNDSQRPPYTPETLVTVESVYGDDEWLLPVSWFPAGSHNKRKLGFYVDIELENGTKRRLVRESLLVQQLKESAYAILHLSHTLSEARKATTLADIFKIVRKLVIAAAEVGCRSLSEVTPANVQRIVELTTSSPARRLMVANWIDHLVALSNRGYISDGIQAYEFEIDAGVIVRDTSIERGLQPLPDAERQLLLSKLLLVHDNREGFIEWTSECLKTPSAAPHARDWLATIFPIVAEKYYYYPEVLAQTYQVGSGGLIGEALGCRPSELLSIKAGFVHRGGSEAFTSFDYFELDTVTAKAVKQVGGVERRLRIPELVYDAALGLEDLHSLLGERTDHLFSGVDEDICYNVNRWNAYLKRFGEMAEIPFGFTQYTFRKNLITNISRAVTNGLAAAEVVVGHVERDTTAGYALSNPFVREDIYSACMDAFRDRTRTLLEATAAAGGKGVGGNGGRLLEARVASLSVDGGTVVPEDLAAFVDELLRQEVVPIPVAPGILCMKQGTVRGECGKTTGDVIPDIGRCSAECPWQVQEMFRKDLVQWEFAMVRSGGLKTSSKLQKTYWMKEMKEQLTAWPDLRETFRTLLRTTPELRGIG
ncbi:site-specific integrase [Rhizobium leguminosarum]|uniref:site-specific integrase n=1 Tax=Rhizobium leguminosarum TaxID=384 RepID=UPI00102F78BF|nr:site-specific integrase [Rhizobium leguminosarum]MBY5504100.1 site-specific integrase [Rhizobium leguminosarum]TBG85539.1 site-specific integrase [Rhizobium leguminosarum]